MRRLGVTWALGAVLAWTSAGHGGNTPIRPLLPLAAQTAPTLPALYLPVIANGVAFETELRAVGRIDTYTTAVAAGAGQRAYVAQGQRLRVVDLSDPSAPAVLGETDWLGFYLEDLVLRPPYVLAAAGQAGLRVFDVSDPAHIRLAGGLVGGTPVYALAVQGERAYVAAGRQGLVILDIADPLAPRVLGQLTAIGPDFFDRLENASDVAVSGSVAFVSNNDEYGLWAVDVSDPGAPRRLDYATQQDGVAVAVSGAHVYLVDNDSGLTVYDATDPSRLALVGGLDARRAHDIAIAGSHAYLATTGEVKVLDVANPAATRQVASIAVPGSGLSVQVSGSLALVADGSGGLRLAGVADPAAPVPVGALGELGEPRVVATCRQHAYVGTATEPGLAAVDLTDLRHPRVTSFVALPQTPLDVLCHGQQVYVADGYAGLHVLDASDPARLRPLAVLAPPGYMAGLAALDTTLYVAAAFDDQYRGLVRVVDVSEPSAPAEVGAVFTPVDAHGPITVGAGRLWVADSAGVQAFDLGEPRAPRLVSQLPGYHVGIAVTGMTAAVLTQSRLSLYDIGDPVTWRPRGGLDLTGAFYPASTLDVFGSRAWVAANGGLLGVDLAEPDTPRLAATTTDVPAFDVAALDEHRAVVAAGWRGLVVLQDPY